MKPETQTWVLVLGILWLIFVASSFLIEDNTPIVNASAGPKQVTLLAGQSIHVKKGSYTSHDYLSYSGIINPAFTQGGLTLVDYEWVSTGGIGAPGINSILCGQGFSNCYWRNNNNCKKPVREENRVGGNKVNVDIGENKEGKQ